MPLKRLERVTTKDILWIYILKLLKTRDMYAYEIRSELNKRFNFSPALVTPYVVLYRLENKGKTLFDKGIRHLEGMLKKLSQ